MELERGEQPLLVHEALREPARTHRVVVLGRPVNVSTDSSFEGVVDERQEPQLPAQRVLGTDAPDDGRDVMPDRPLRMAAPRHAPAQPGH